MRPSETIDRLLMLAVTNDPNDGDIEAALELRRIAIRLGNKSTWHRAMCAVLWVRFKINPSVVTIEDSLLTTDGNTWCVRYSPVYATPSLFRPYCFYRHHASGTRTFFCAICSCSVSVYSHDKPIWLLESRCTHGLVDPLPPPLS